jgi:outer membrane autotransporter protein
MKSRLDDIRSGSTGFSSNMKLDGATADLESKPGADGKSSKNVVEPILQPGPANRWGVWVTGFGDFVNVDGDGNANGYDFTTGGFSLGVDYRISDSTGDRCDWRIRAYLDGAPAEWGYRRR